MQVIDLQGESFGRLRVLDRLGRTACGGARWLCLCACGRLHVAASTDLRRGVVRSCGCATSEFIAEAKTTHGHTRAGAVTPEYSAWRLMLSRCRQETNVNFRYYGGRGIRVCEEWQRSFEQFLADVGPKPSPEYSIDRVDFNGHYEPGNVRWATRAEQARNRRTNRVVTFRGTTMSLAEAAERAGIPYGRASARLRRGWPLERALEAA